MNAQIQISAVHPRMRGERKVDATIKRVAAGSSPHARGTLIALPAQRQLGRFIPACAGNASTRHPAAHARPVHPRMRGERKFRDLPGKNVYGSSPHARGTLILHGPQPAPLRFIPACAGNAGISRLIRHSASVHPRMRGERATTWNGKHAVGGSSPHARGTLSRRNAS